jgi:DNA-binding NarL/FixJ family response regulator
MFPAIAPKSYSILLAEDLLLVLEGLAAWCQAQGGYRVVAQCCEGISALRLIECDKPDIAILDLNLRDLSTLAIVRKLRDAQTQTRIVILSTRNDERIVLEALRSGANAFLLKSDPTNHLLEAFDQILSGGIYISPSFKIDNIFNLRQKHMPENPLQMLSPRESQVFTWLVEGIRAKEIAARLSLSAKTVDTYRASMMRKLDISSVAGLVRFAIKQGVA